MRSRYGLELIDNCRTCTTRSKGFFCQSSPADLKAFQVIKYTAAYPAGSILFVEGQPAQGVYVLCKGRVKLSMTSSEGKTLILRIAKPGQLLGLHAMVLGAPYQETAETLEATQVNFIKHDDFLHFLHEHRDASIRAAQQLSSSYQAACEQLRSLGLSQSAHEKLARFLLEWSSNGQKAKQGICAKLTLTHEEIGQIIGTSRETVTRTLGEFRSKHLAEIKGSTLVIQDKAALEGFVGT